MSSMATPSICCPVASTSPIDPNVIRLVVLDEPPKNVGKEKRNFGGYARRRIHPVHRRIKSAVDVRHRVDKKKFFRARWHAGEYSKASVKELARRTRKKKSGRRGCSALLRGPVEVTAQIYCRLGFSGRDFGSGLGS